MHSSHFILNSPQLLRLFSHSEDDSKKPKNPQKAISPSPLENHDPNKGHSCQRNQGFISGIIQNWEADIEQRIQEIQSWKQRSLPQQMWDKCKRQEVPMGVSGNEIAKLHPMKSALAKVNQLKQNPMDSKSRLELVALVSRSNRDFPLEVYQMFLIHSTVANCFGQLSTTGLQQILRNQEIYFSKLLQQYKREAATLKLRLGTKHETRDVYTNQTQALRQHLENLERNIQTIQVYQNQTSKVLKENPTDPGTTLRFDEITGLLLRNSKEKGQKNKIEEKKKRVLKAASEILLLMRAIPFLHKEAEKFLRHLKKLAPIDPTLVLLGAKLSMSDLIFKVGQYQEGERTTLFRTAIQEAFNKTHQQYGLALRKVGKFPKTPVEIMIIADYAHLVHYYYRVTQTTLGVPLPHDWLTAIFKKTMKLLQMIPEAQSFEKLTRDIQNDMAKEGIDVPLFNNQH